MKKYKLIKEYPGSPELGYILKPTIHTEFETKEYILYNQILTPINYPEFWQEVIEKDYKILSLQNVKSLSYIDNEILDLNRIKNTGYTLDSFLNDGQSVSSGHFKIYSVKRLSDGEIFTIGDKIYSTNWTCSNIDKKSDILTEISLNTEFMFKTKITWQCNLKDIQHYKQPLFTTEDGVDIYKGDMVYYTLRNLNHNCSIPLEGKWCENSIAHSENIHFSTKEKAEEYILLNKPCLSYGDIQKFIKLGECNKVLDLVKSKL